MSSYKGATPSLTIDPRIPGFFEKFYAISDNPSEESHTVYANSLTKNGTMVMGSKKVEGHDAILELRKGMLRQSQRASRSYYDSTRNFARG